MKKTIVIIALLSLVTLAPKTYAGTCGDTKLNHGEIVTFDGSATTTTPAVNLTACDGGNPMNVSQAWGLTGAQTPTMKSGEAVTDAHGVSDTCPTWYPQGCVNLTSTDFYKNQMIMLAQQLVSTGFASQFPQFAGWVNSIK